MKKTAKMLAVLLLAGVCLCTSCANEAPPQNTETDPPVTTQGAPAQKQTYTVQVVDCFGKAMSDIIVMASQNGETVGLSRTNTEGVASFSLLPDSYEVSLDFPNAADQERYTYQTEGLHFDASELTALTVQLYNVWNDTEPVTAYSPVSNSFGEVDAIVASEGGVYVRLEGSERTYFVFRPTRTGVYKISFQSDARFELGYYGGTANSAQNTLLPVENKSIELVVRNSNLASGTNETTAYLFGLAAKSSLTDCVFSIERLGDPPFDPVDEPWKTLMPGRASDPYAYLNWTFSGFCDLDLTDTELAVVYNETDGYYHYGSAEGPIVFLRLNTASAYLSALSEIANNTQMGVYFYDEGGNFLYKESYNELLLYYSSIADATTGVCPLNQQLEYVLKTVGEYWGWWQAGSGRYLFEGKTVNAENAWLFACGYYETVTPDTHGGATDPIKLSADGGTVMLKYGKTLHFTYTGNDTATLTIENADGMQLTCNGTTYLPKDGTILLSVAKGASITLSFLSEHEAQAVTFDFSTGEK